MLDTFDINGNFLGVQTREFCHSKSPRVYHKPVWIWIINDKSEILVQKRALTKKNSPGKWDMPSAGHIAAGESITESCIRETREELGLYVNQDNFIFLKQFVNQKGWELVQVFLLKNNTKVENMKLQKEEVEQVKWLNYYEFVKLFYSDEFCNHEKNYKDWVCEELKKYL